MMKHFYHIPIPKCGAEDWIIIEKGHAKLTNKALKEHGNISCSISYIGWIDDFRYKWIEYKDGLKGQQLMELKEDFFRAKCISAADGASYDNVHAGVSYKPQLHEQLYIENPRGMNLNILMIGFDSISHMTYIRKMPKTLEYFRSSMDGLILNGYNIVGDGTPQAFIPILTGKTELELPVVYKRLKKRDFVDVYPMIWKEYKQQGYVTTFIEDFPGAAMFTYRLSGFKTQPTDHYMRPFYMASEHIVKQQSDLCIGGKRKSEVFMNYVRDLYAIYPTKPKFAIGFLGDMSHNDQNKVETADVDLFDLLKELHSTGKLNNTILILMSDHGARYSELRAELQGKHEERLPFFAFAFPPWFKTKYPAAYENFKINTNRLTTPFDIHATFKSILQFDGTGKGDVTDRGISLFKEVPKSRTCEHADIPAHWCSCLNWYAAPTSDKIIQMAATHVIVSINNYISFEKECATLHLHNITRALQFLPQEALIKFKKAADMDGFKPDLSDHTYIDTILYQVWFYVKPSMGFFEATVKYDVKSKQFSNNMNDVSRINRYGNDAVCAHGGRYDIRKYCYCKT